MPKFEPQPGTIIQIGLSHYEVMPHPGAPGMAFAQEGRKGFVYQLRNGDRLLALKYFKRPYRQPRLVETCQTLFGLKKLPGLAVCERLCLTRAVAPDIIEEYPEMEYAMLMPWVAGSTWFDVLFQKREIAPQGLLRLAQSMAHVLATLETKGLAHCDIASANVIMDIDAKTVGLIDMEDMYGAGLIMTDAFPSGTDGYRHRQIGKAPQGQWCAEGDRFAGAVLLAEMVAWANPDIRAAAGAEQLFGEGEQHSAGSEIYLLMMDTLRTISPEIATLFNKAWSSGTLADCPSLAAWSACVASLKSLEGLLNRPKALVQTPSVAFPMARGGSYRCDQRRDDLLFFREETEAYVRWLYVRSYASRSNVSESQNFLTWRYEAERKTLDFVICDGVGSSFCGHIAAQELGTRLLEGFLMDRWADLERLSNDSAVAELAMRQLNGDWKKLAQLKVIEEPLPKQLSEIVRTALEQQRDQIGSETVFLCGHLALEAGVRKLILLWMGDTQIRLFDQNGQPIPVEGRWVNSDRWSTLRGTRGQVHARIFNLDEVNLERIIAFSNGLASVADTVHQLDDSALQETVATLFTSPTSDDISFIDIRLKRSAQSDRLAIPTIAHKGNTVDWESIPDATTGDDKLTPRPTFSAASLLGTPKIGTIERVNEGQPFTLRWSDVQGAQEYELQVARSNIQAFTSIYQGDKTEYCDQIAEAGERFYRVRALVDNAGPSSWSAVCVVTIGQPDTLQSLASRQQYIAQQPNSLPNKQPLGIPHLRLRDHVKNGQYVLDWTFVSDATGYEWQEETLLPNGGRTFVRGDKTAPQQRSMSLINKEGTYYYRVRAFTQNRFGEYSDKLEVKVRKSLIENFKQSAKDLITFGSSTSSQIRQANIKLTVDLGSSNQVAVGQSYRLSWSCAVPVDVFEVRGAKLAKPGQLPRDNDYEWVTDTHECYVTLSHRSPGLRYLRVRAIDKNRYPSEWSEPLQIEVVKTLQYQQSSIQPQLAVWSLENIRRSCNVTPNWVEIRLEWKSFSSWYLLSRQTNKGTADFKTSEHFYSDTVYPGITRYKVYAANDRWQPVGDVSEYLVVTVRKVQPEQLEVDINASKG